MTTTHDQLFELAVLARTEHNEALEELGELHDAYASLQAKYDALAFVDGALPLVGTPPVDDARWEVQRETDFDSLADWDIEDGTSTAKGAPWGVAKNQTQGNDNSVNLAKNVRTVPGKGLVIAGLEEDGYAKPYTTGEIVGKGIEGLEVPNYFRAEVRGLFDDIPGVWPCLLWFRPVDDPVGEIDLMEWMGGLWKGTDRRVAITMHNGYGANHRPIKRPMILRDAAWFDPNVPHTYTMEKTPGMIRVWIDARLVATFTPADATWWNAVMERPDLWWYPRITLQIGKGSNTAVVPDPGPTFHGTSIEVNWLRFYRPRTPRRLQVAQ